MINLHWYNEKINVGDILSPYIISRLFKAKINYTDYKSKDFKYFAIGSIIERADNNTIIWGSGLIRADSTLINKPLLICAVRGPLTRDLLKAQQIDCPEVYGDPALLLPKIYNPKRIIKKYRLGIIPHYVDKQSEYLSNCYKMKDILIIDVQNKNPIKFIDQVLSCELIGSSSLHGLIIADAYAIPSVWLQFSEKVIGEGFKFRDYFASVKRKTNQPLHVNKEISIDNIYENSEKYKIEIDVEKLYHSAPFWK